MNIFKNIIDGKLKTKIIYKDKDVTVFNDLNPRALVHIIIIPNIYIKNMNWINKNHIFILGKMLFIASKIAKKKKIHKNGYRIVINCNKYAGQEIFYLHMHLLGGNYLGNMVN